MPLILRLFVNYVLGYLVNHVTIPNRFLPRDPLLWFLGTFGKGVLSGVRGLWPSQRKAPSEPPTGWAAGDDFYYPSGEPQIHNLVGWCSDLRAYRDSREQITKKKKEKIVEIEEIEEIE